MSRRDFLTLLVVVGVLLASTAVMFIEARRIEDRQIEADFHAVTTTQYWAVTRTLDVYAQVVRGIDRLYAASEEVERAEFRAFVQRDLARRRGIRALEWVPRVQREDRLAFEVHARRDGVDGFAFRRWHAGAWASSKEDWGEYYYPAYFVEPAEGNDGVFGLDMGSHPDRLRTLERAGRTGVAAVTPPIVLAHGDAKPIGVLFFVPVYDEKCAPLVDGAAAEFGLCGFALGAFEINRVVGEALSGIPRYGTSLQIVDVDEGATRVLYGEPDSPGGPGLTQSIDHEFGGRTWRFAFAAVPAFADARRGGTPWLVGGAGLLVTLLAGLLLFHSFSRARRVQALVTKRTAQLAEANEALKARP